MKVAVVGCLMVLTVTALVLMVTGGCETTSEVPARTAAAAPETMREPVVDTLHGEIIVDPYRWLEDQWSPRTRSWIEAQNRYASRLLAQLPGREELHSRFEELMRRTAVSRPITRRNRLFYSQRLPDQELSALYMREGAWGALAGRLVADAWLTSVLTAVLSPMVSDRGALMRWRCTFCMSIRCWFVLRFCRMPCILVSR